MPETLFSLAEDIRRCTKCPLWKGRLLAVPGEGGREARIMVIGEAPGAEEDRQGLPFVGRSGKYLTSLFDSIGLKREDVFITSCVKCRPPKNRVPVSYELKTCKENWLSQQITLLDPKLIILVGGVALSTVLGKKNLRELHGKVVREGGRKYFVTFHPAAALRFPRLREEMKKDFLALKKVMAK